MSTVGFGDLYPITHFGRFVIVLASFWGMFMVSHFVYTMEITSAFTYAENKVYETMERLQGKQKLKEQAATLIQVWWKCN